MKNLKEILSNYIGTFVQIHEKWGEGNIRVSFGKLKKVNDFSIVIDRDLMESSPDLRVMIKLEDIKEIFYSEHKYKKIDLGKKIYPELRKMP